MTAARATDPNEPAPLIVFIGSGEASVVERRVLIHTLRTTTRRPLDIRVVNGTHNAIEREGRIEPLPLSLRLKYRQGDTEFGLCRWLVPALCEHRGRALYLDSDILCLGDIGALFDAPFGDAQLLGLPRARGATGVASWRTAVMPIDCAATRFDCEAIFDEIDRGLFTQADFMQLTPRFLARHPYRIGRLDPAWHGVDSAGPATRLIHYTDMHRQPWKVAGHPYGALWLRAFRSAFAAGAVTEVEVELSVRRHYVRPDILRAPSLRERTAMLLARWIAARG